MISNYISSIRKLFEYYKLLGEKTIAQLDEKQLFERFDPESNSVAIIVGHLSGNMLSRWTDFLNTDGEKEWRDRDEEFKPTIENRVQLLEQWEEGWKCLFEAIVSVNEENFDQPVFIRNQGHTITEAINRQLAHYSYHIGQIVLLGRFAKGNDWQSLSIPKGGSSQYNTEKFSNGKQREHFTDEFLKKKE